MNGTNDTIHSRRRDREVAAKHRVEEIESSLERQRRRVGVLRSEIQQASALRGQTGERAHEVADSLLGGAEELLRQELRAYLPQLKNLVRERPDPPPPALMAAFALNRYRDGFLEALHEAIDAAVADPSTAVFEIATESEVQAGIDEKRQEATDADARVSALEAELAAAKAEQTDAIHGRG